MTDPTTPRRPTTRPAGTEAPAAARPGHAGRLPSRAEEPAEQLGPIWLVWKTTWPVWAIYMALGLVISFAYFFAPPGTGHHLIYDGLGLSSVVAILVGVHRHKPALRMPWYLFAAGNLCFVTGDVIRGFYESVLGVEAPFPSMADVAYLAAYPVLAAGLVLLVRSRDKIKNRGNAIDAMIVVTAVGLIAWVYLMRPYTQDPSVQMIEILISIAYPLGTLMLLAVLARLMIGQGTRPPAYYLLGTSLVALMLSDAAYTFTLLNETYFTGSLVDAGWLVSYVVWGAAALHPSMRTLSQPTFEKSVRVSRGRLALLAVASLIAPAVRIFELARGEDLDHYTTVVPTVILFLLVMARMSGLVEMLTSTLDRHEEAERQRRRSEARFGSLVQHASDVVTVVDGSGEITFQSPSVTRVLGYKSDALLGKPMVDLIAEDDRPAIMELLGEVTDRPTRHPASGMFRWRHQDGTLRNVEATFTNLLEDPTVGGVVLNARDVTEQTILQDQLSHQAFHDPLTDLANRALFRDRVEHALDRRRRPDEPIAVLFLDLDDFKTLNDSLGHSAGDELLIQLADRIRGCVRGGDTAARLGGDEFAILLEDATDAEAAAQRIGDALTAPFEIDDKSLFVTVSIGVGVSEMSQGGADELLRNADVAMYAAKSGGKGKSVVFSPDLHQQAVHRLDLESDLRRAIERDEFRLHYQPLVEVSTGRITGFEALIRWAHPERGLVPPNDFIPVAEDTDLIRPIGRWVITEAARQARAWQVKYPSENLTMSVNISAKDLMSNNLVREVGEALGAAGLDPRSLMLEMTERVIMADTDVTIKRLTELRELGVGISVDDFGTGFSSLSYLRNFPIDALKIAKPFLDGVPASEQEAALVRGIVELGHRLDLDVVAEGVERQEQLDALKEMGCDRVQGFLLARPQGPKRIEELLETSVIAAPGVHPANGAPQGLPHVSPGPATA